MSDEITHLEIQINRAEGKLQRAIKEGANSTQIDQLKRLISSLKDKLKALKWAAKQSK